MGVRALLLSAGLGTRLRPLTDLWPKCLMPVRKRPLLEYWLETLRRSGIERVLVNLHYIPEPFRDFLKQPQYEGWVETSYEPVLLGTAGTLRANADFFKGHDILLIHTDNYCCCDFQDFLDYHQTRRPPQTLMTMMTYSTTIPHACGIVKLDPQGVVREFHEKVKNPPGNLANAAVYFLDHHILEWLLKQPSDVTDMSTQILPQFIGNIATWHNDLCHRDIGTLPNFKAVQNDPVPFFFEELPSTVWQEKFEQHPIHQYINQLLYDSSI
ncbi:MAG: nucleotidyltransferase family protein [SAR324 cluster bacterium]|nr:nucleotidyltransferase family protein [SAR324 cluster bacterium]MBF0351778.1 nucleotidyltransferase family protein [SAR324 cluster bacterium]